MENKYFSDSENENLLDCDDNSSVEGLYSDDGQLSDFSDNNLAEGNNVYLNLLILIK